jgi:hypothetical protein
MATSSNARVWTTRSFKALLTVILCVVSGVVGGALNRHFGTSSYSLSYADFVSIMLTAVSLLITVLAVFLAVFGFIGWNAIENRVHEKTKNFLDEEFEEGKSLYNMLESRATEIIYQGILPIAPGDSEDQDTDDAGSAVEPRL